jgi:uncharacterized alpha-E superfamily protein
MLNECGEVFGALATQLQELDALLHEHTKGGNRETDANEDDGNAKENSNKEAQSALVHARTQLLETWIQAFATACEEMQDTLHSGFGFPVGCVCRAPRLM